jgi:hypothetical protein
MVEIVAKNRLIMMHGLPGFAAVDTAEERTHVGAYKTEWSIGADRVAGHGAATSDAAGRIHGENGGKEYRL